MQLMCQLAEEHPSQPVSLTEGQNLAFLQPNPLEESPCLVMAVLLLRMQLGPTARETTLQPSPSARWLSGGAMPSFGGHFGNLWGHFYCYNV